MSSKRGLRGVPSSSQATASLMRSLRRRDVAGRLVSARAEEMILHLPLQVLTCALVREVQPVLVDQHRLLLQPLLPGFLADALVDALAQFAGIGGKVETLGVATELDAVDGACHSRLLVIWGLAYADMEVKTLSFVFAPPASRIRPATTTTRSMGLRRDS